jgi:hypothetical protein
VAKRPGGQAAEQAQAVRKTQCIKTLMAQGDYQDVVIRPTSWQKLATRCTNACKDQILVSGWGDAQRPTAVARATLALPHLPAQRGVHAAEAVEMKAQDLL